MEPTLHDRLVRAIAEKRLIQLEYSSRVRIVEPHDYGAQKSVDKLLAYQLRRTGGAQSKADVGWRLFEVPKMGPCAVLERTFRGSRREAHQHHYEWDVLYARVN